MANTAKPLNQDCVWFVYDGQCPLCRMGATYYRVRQAVGALQVLDARQHPYHPLMREIQRLGLNLDRGMVIKFRDTCYQGAEALHVMAMLGTRTGWFNRINAGLFRSKTLSTIFYPLFRSIRGLLLLLRGVGNIDNLRQVSKGCIIKDQLGADWHALHPAIQQRFARDPEGDEIIHYQGTIRTCRSRAGWLFAHLTRPVGNPLTPYQGEDVALDVRLFQSAEADGICWERTYHFPRRSPYVVTSVKRTGRCGEMLECVGGGFGMVLDVYAENQQLHFRSRRYFWQMGRFRLPLPHLISPGESHVVHADLGDGDFRFTISMTHPWLGRTFFQDGIFRRKEDV